MPGTNHGDSPSNSIGLIEFFAKNSPESFAINRFTCGGKVIPQSMIDECLNLYSCWVNARKEKCSEDIYCSMLDENRRVHETVLRYYKRLGLIGRVVTIDGNIKAYTFGFAVNREMFCVLFEVADLNIKGLATYIFRELCRDEAICGYKFINGMDDFGMDNIRQIKMSFNPCALLPSYVVTKGPSPDEPASF